MIIQKQPNAPDRKKSPLVGLLLFLVSVFLFIVTGPIGFIYGLLHSLFTRGPRGGGEYLLQLAISIDQLGNVLMQHLLNAIWIRPGGYPFGNRDETISSALGRNKREGLLTGFGKFIDAILDQIDPNHSLNSIDYYIEPSDRIIEAVSWIHISDGRILCTRSRDHTEYFIPGGKREPHESEAGALAREIEEELGIILLAGSLEHVGTFEAQAAGEPPGILVRLACYTGGYTGEPAPQAEVVEMVWLRYADLELVAPADQLVFELLRQRGMLS